MKRLVVLALTACAVLTLRAGAQERQPELKRLRVLMVIDTYAPRLKEIVQRDKQHMQKLLREGIPADRCTIDYLEGKNAVPENITRYYTNLDVQPDEALLFFYVGHGGMTESDHYLQIEGDSRSPHTFGGARYYKLRRKTIINAMRARRPGLAVMLTACCSTYIPERPDNTLGSTPPIKGEAARQIKPLLRSLFFEHRGVVDITAAPPGEPALGVGSFGTFFTNNLVKLAARDDLRRFGPKDGFVTWKAFHKELKSDMNGAAMAFKRAQEQAMRDGKLKRVEPALDVQLAYDYQLAGESRVPRSKWLFGVGVNEYRGRGLKVLNVLPNTPAAKAGLQVGDVLLSINGSRLETTYDFLRTVANSEGTVRVEYVSGRTGRTERVEMKLEKF